MTAMPFDKSLYEGYCVKYPEKKYRSDRTSLFGLLTMLWACFLFGSLLIGMQEGYGQFLIWLPFYLITGWLLLRWKSKPEPEKMKIWVQGDRFCTELNGQRSRGYRFSEITRVTYHCQLSSSRGRPGGWPYWGMYIENECVAVFENDMENSGKLLAKLEDYGLITMYGTGYRPKN